MKKMNLGFGILVIQFIFVSFAIEAGGSSPQIIDGDVYRINVNRFKKDGLSALEIVVTPKGNVHCNLEYPWKLKILERGDVYHGKYQFSAADAKMFTLQKVVFQLPLNSLKQGEMVEFEVKFSMCDDTQCYMKKVPIEYRFK